MRPNRSTGQGSSRIDSARIANIRATGPGSVNTSSLIEMTKFAWNKALFKKIAGKFGFEQKRRKRPDFSILVIVMIMIALGTLTLYAIGPAVLKRTGGGLGRQTMFLFIGLTGMLIAYKIPKPDILIKLAPYLFALSLVLCALILIPGVGKVVYGGRRWIGIGSFSMQPSEVVKAALVFFLSGIAVYFKSTSKNENTQTFYLAGLMGLISLFVLILQRDLGTTLVISTISLFILIASGTSKKVLSRLVFLGLIGFSLSILMFGYRRDRLISFISRGAPTDSSEVESPGDYHLRQSLIAVGSGGIAGRGVGNSVQSFGYLPEAPSDSIFAVYAEKFGLMGSILLLGLFGALIKKMLRVMEGLDAYWKTVVGGITGWTLGNFMVNMGSILGLIPFSGVPLPFFSLGGTNLVIMLTMMGIILNLSSYRTSRLVMPRENVGANYE